MPSLKTKQALGMAFLGLATGLFQIVFLRELMVVSGGSEFSLAISFASWLFSIALGSLMGSRLTLIPGLPFVMLMVALTALGSFVLARWLPYQMALFHQAQTLCMSFLIHFLVLFPIGFASGGAFPLILGQWQKNSQETRLGFFYALEALGASLAGCAFSFLLVHFLPSGGIIFSGCLVLVVFASCVSEKRLKSMFLALSGLVALGVFHSDEWDQKLSFNTSFQGRTVISKETPYARLTVTKKGEQYDFYASGNWLFSIPDPLLIQSRALFPLLAKPKAQTALYLGGPAEVMAVMALKKSSLKKAVALELDPFLGSLLETTQTSGRKVPGLKRVFGDGRIYLAEHPKAFDLIVVNYPAPSTFKDNRYYTLQGFKAMARALKPKGAVIVSLPSLSHLAGPLQLRRLKTVLETSKEVFGQVIVFSGDTMRLVMSLEKGFLPLSEKAWINRLENTAWQDVYSLRPDILREELSPRRKAFLQDMLAQINQEKLNLDFWPRALLFDTGLWGKTLYNANEMALFMARFKAKYFVWFLAALGLFLFLGGLVGKKGLVGWVVNPAFGVMLTGFSSMGLSLLLIMAVQILLGAVYLGLALLSAAFMFGLALSAGNVLRFIQDERKLKFWLPAIHLAFALVCFFMMSLTYVGGVKVEPWLWRLLCWGLSFLVGVLTGCYFAITGKLKILTPKNLPKLGGKIYAWELLGSMAGALLPIALLPCIGFENCLFLILLLNLLPVAPISGAKLSKKRQLSF